MIDTVMKRIVMPLDELEVMEGELIMVRGGHSDKKKNEKSGCDCAGNQSDPGCDCEGGAGCGCGCKSKKKTDDSKWKWV